jgi:hypothetical protein
MIGSARSFTAFAALVAVLGGVGSQANADLAPHGTDIAGDANGVNGQGQKTLTGVPGSTSTGPASYAPADLREVFFETPFEAVPVGQDGIDYRATGLRIRLSTESTPTSQAHTLVYSVVGRFNECNGRLKVHLRGPLSAAGDPADRSLYWSKATGTCPDGTGDVAMSGSTVTVDAASKELAITIPLASLSEPQRPYFAPDALIAGIGGGGYYDGIRAVVSGLVRGQTDLLVPGIDDTPNMPDFTIGSDMPSDVPCTIGCP